MARKAQQLKTLQDAIRHFSDEETCIDTVVAMRWPDGKPECPACGRKDHYWLDTQKRWKCKECWKQFSVKVGTIFEDSPLSLTKWLPALWMIVNCKNGISSYELARDLGVSQKSAWFMLHRLRTVFKPAASEQIGGGSGPVEADETFVGPNPRKMHKDRRVRMMQKESEKQGFKARTVGKTIVMGMLDRDARQVRAMVIPDVKRATLQEQILKHVKGGTKVYTDEHPAYKFALVDKFAHEVIDHMKGYAAGQVHTQGIENFWSLLKRTLRGTYVAVEPYHLDRYVDEQVFRYNNRATKSQKVSDADRFYLALSQIAGKRLTFSEVTGKVTPTCS